METQIRHVVAVSGGKDSTAMALRLRELNPEIDYEFVCTPTGDELPEMQAHFDLLGRKLGSELIQLGDKRLDELITQWNMLPNHRARWCTREIKIEPFINYMERLPPNSVLYVGLRADETGRLGLISPDSEFLVDFPMQRWGWNMASVLDYLHKKEVQVPIRTDCAKCFWQTLNQWYQLYINHRHIYVQGIFQEQKTGHTFRSPQRDTWPASLLDLAKEFDKGRIPKIRKSPARKAGKCRFCTM